MQITDAQIHLWTVPAAPPHHHRTPYPIERALAEMDEAGVDRAVNCPAMWDPAANEYGAQAAAAHPDRCSTRRCVAPPPPPTRRTWPGRRR